MCVCIYICLQLKRNARGGRGNKCVSPAQGKRLRNSVGHRAAESIPNITPGSDGTTPVYLLQNTYHTWTVLLRFAHFVCLPF